jgi:L-aminopeptidase/D-esterase-like protein
MDFHEGHGTVGAGQGHSMAWQGNGMGTAGAQHAMGEPTLMLAAVVLSCGQSGKYLVALCMCMLTCMCVLVQPTSQ